MGGGGASASADNNLTFNDTSEYLYRNSSTKRGGFEGTIGRVTNNTDLSINGSEDVSRSQELLNSTSRAALQANIATLTSCVVDSFCTDRTHLAERAHTAWDRAFSLYPDLKAQLDQEIADEKQEAIDRICLAKNQWARTAGSSLNCLVQGMEAKAEIELTRRLSGIIAERLTRFKEHETAAIQQAFQMEMEAHMQTTQLAFSHIGNLYNILRGAEVQDVTDRDYSESRNEDQTQLTLMGKFFHDVTDIADNSGTYSADLDDAYSTSTAIAGLVPSA